MCDYEAIDWDEKDCERMIAAQDLSVFWSDGDEVDDRR